MRLFIGLVLNKINISSISNTLEPSTENNLFWESEQLNWENEILAWQ